MALPNLKTKFSKHITAKSAAGSHKSSPKRTESTFNIKDGIEILESLEFSKFSKHNKINIDSYVSKEISKLEKELDTSEINMYGATINCEQEFRIYKLFLEKVSMLAGKKDSKLGNILIRGLTGCEKAFKKLNIQIRAEMPKKPDKQNNLKKEAFTQTIFIEQPEILPENSNSLEIDAFKSLSGAFKNIKVSRISNQLVNLYNSLNEINTDIPSPSESPELEMPEFKLSPKTAKVQLTFIRQNIGKILKGTEVKKLGIPKEVQTDFDRKRKTLVALENMNEEKELDIFKLRSKFSSLKHQKEKLEESLLRSNNMCSEFERKIAANDMELTHLRHDNSGLLEKVKEYEENAQKYQSEIDEADKKIEYFKEIIRKLKQSMRKKGAELQQSLSLLYNTQVY